MSRYGDRDGRDRWPWSPGQVSCAIAYGQTLLVMLTVTAFLWWPPVWISMGLACLVVLIPALLTRRWPLTGSVVLWVVLAAEAIWAVKLSIEYHVLGATLFSGLAFAHSALALAGLTALTVTLAYTASDSGRCRQLPRRLGATR